VTGWVNHDDVPAQLNDLRLLVLPSQPTEGLPTTVLEALACGTPVYASPVSGVPDVVRPGKTGFLIEDREPEALQVGIVAILAGDDLASRLPERSRPDRERVRSRGRVRTVPCNPSQRRLIRPDRHWPTRDTSATQSTQV